MMIFNNKMLDAITSKGETFHFQGWIYDLVLDSLEKSGFKLQERLDFLSRAGVEGSVYWHPQRGLVKVVTSRLRGPFTIVEPYGFPEKPKGQG